MSNTKTVSVKINENIKYGEELYKKDSNVEVSIEHYKQFREKGITDDEFDIDELDDTDTDADTSIYKGMTVPELENLAEENNIDLAGAKKKDDIIKIIKDKLGDA